MVEFKVKAPWIFTIIKEEAVHPNEPSCFYGGTNEEAEKEAKKVQDIIEKLPKEDQLKLARIGITIIPTPDHVKKSLGEITDLHMENEGIN